MKIALAQILVHGGEVAANLMRAEGAIADAAAQGAHLVVLPEALDCGWTHPSARVMAGTIPGGSAFERLRVAARHARVYVCAGLVERSGERLFNAAVLVSSTGELLLHHRKIHELEIAHDLYNRGARLEVTETEHGTMGVMICADAFAPGECVSRTLALMGAKLIVSPCAWAVPADHNQAREPYGQLWRDCYGAVARDHHVWVAGASNVGPITAGPWKGRRCIGSSLLIGPDGGALLTGPYGETATATLIAQIMTAES